jgi:hypothetical protein
MPGKPSFHVGDAVIVNPSVMDPDEPTISLTGWQGWVTDIYAKEGTLAFKWDSLVLRSVPADYIRKCELAGLGWETMILEMDEVSPATPRDTLRETEATYKEIMAHHRWDHLSDINPGISELLGPLGKVDELTYLHTWAEHLLQMLRFPFKARREEQFRRGPVAVGDIVEVVGIADVEDLYGLLASVRLDRRSYTVPLCDLEATDPTSSNYQPLNDYVVWFANR